MTAALTKLFAKTQSLLAVTLEQAGTVAPFTLHETPDIHIYCQDKGIYTLHSPSREAEFSLILSCGIHGNETAPIELCDQLVKALIQKKQALSCTLMVIFGHIDAIKQGQRFIDENLNRMFGQSAPNPMNTAEQARAQTLINQVRDFVNTRMPLLHYDLHTAIRPSLIEKFAIVPFNDSQSLDGQQLALLANFGVEAVVLSHKPSSTFSAHTCSQYGARAFTIELGKVHTFGQNPPNITLPAFNTLMALITGESVEHSNISPPESYRVVHEIIKRSNNFQLFLSEEAPNFTPFESQFLLAQDGDYAYYTHTHNERIIFPNPHVAVGQRAGLVIAPI